MKRFATSVSIALIVLSVGLCDNVAWSQMKKDLNQAAVDGDLDRVKTLVGEGSDVNSLNRMGMTPLVVAAMNNRTAVCEFLIGNGADLNAKDGRGQTALYFAVEKKNKPLVELLVKKGADVNITTGRGQNALSLAQTNGSTEIADFLTKNGAKAPVVDSLYGDEGYGGQGMPAGGRPGMPRTGAARGMPQAAVEVDLLADPNKIRATVKSFEGLEKAITDVGAKSVTENRYWAQTRSDNRTSLARAFQKQVDDEFALVRKIAVEEHAAKSTDAIDKMLKTKKDRDAKVRAALMEQRKEVLAEQQSSRSGGSRSRGSTRSSGRYGSAGSSSSYGRGSSSRSGRGTSSRGYASDGSTDGGAYGDAGTMGGRGRAGRASAKPAEQLDPDTKAEIDLWTQATLDKKLELAKSLHPLVHGDFAYIRRVAVGEEAKKTIAAIDGLLLARKERHDAYVKKAEAEKDKLGPGQTPGQPGDPRMQSTRGRSSGRTRRGATGGTQQQNTQSGGRRRR